MIAGTSQSSAGIGRAAQRLAIQIPPPAQRLSLNGRYHHMVRAEATRAWRTTAALAAHQHRGADLGPSTVTITWPVRDRRRRDRLNLTPTIKAIIDGLVDAGVWSDDHADLVTFGPERFEVVGVGWRAAPIIVGIEVTQ